MQKSFKPKLWTSLLSVALLAGCSSAPDDEAETSVSNVNDPFESFNREMWAINYDYLDPYIVRPVSLAYVDYTPDPVRIGIANFLSNLDEPSSMVNNLIMGNGGKALDHLGRFVVNTTFGLLGFIDIASDAGLTDHNEKTLGDAIGHYGVGNGPYVMVPGYGPWTVRETADFADNMYVPLSLLNFWAGLGKWALEGMETRASLVSQEVMLENSPDPYALTRDVYLQHRDFEAEIESKQQEIDHDEEAYLDEYLEDF
ncbi:VacJ family lipoprotein [Vibrio taketomensis]|uniref:MlaA family lipoprotein n=1 Tax=Vibrio taketomensis TaxID=2572923 RepID=UPI00138A5691|nr:VacJ family lipoprotein [Vibrio taketomensis]